MAEGADQAGTTAGPAGSSSQAEKLSSGSGPFFQGIDWLGFGFTTVVALAVYLLTLAPEVTLGFSGVLSTTALYGGVAHPPGYPVWTVYSWFFAALLPFGSIAWRVAVASAVAAALARGLVALMVSRAGAMVMGTAPSFTGREPAEQARLRIVCGSVAGMALALSQTVWHLAVVVETWSLSVLLFAAMLCLFTRWVAEPGRRRFLCGGFLVLGLLLTSNQELLVVIPALLLVVLLGDRSLGRDLAVPLTLLAIAGWMLSWSNRYYWLGSYCVANAWTGTAFVLVGVAAVIATVQTRRFGSEWKSATNCGLGLLLGLSCYVYLPIASMTDPPINWGYPRTVEGFWHLVTRGQYESYKPTRELSRFIGQLWILAKEPAHGFGWPYMVFTVLPFCLVRRAEPSGRIWLLGLLAIFVCVGPLMVTQLNPSSDPASVALIRPDLGAMYVVIAVWIGVGLMVFGNAVSRARSQPRNATAPAF